MDTLALGLVPLVLMLFPEGRAPSPRWRPVVWVTVVVAVAWTLSTALDPDPGIDGAPNPFNPLWRYAMPAELARWLAVGWYGQSSCCWRWVPCRCWPGCGRHGDANASRSSGWLMRLFFLAAALVPQLVWHQIELGRDASSWHPSGLVRTIPIAAAWWGVYLAIGIAIFRHRLYDIDRLINRTVVYGLLTAGGVGVYVAVVKGAEWLLAEGVGLGGSLVATAVIAVSFAPARDRLQRWVDRRLYGERHDPVRAMARLGERLRDAPGGDVLAGVLQAVCETLRLPVGQPARRQRGGGGLRPARRRQRVDPPGA